MMPEPRVAIVHDWLVSMRGGERVLESLCRLYPRAHVYTGQFYSENMPAGIVAWRGQVVNSTAGRAPRLVGTIGDRSALGGYVRFNDWNQYLVVARGGTFLHVINGQLMAVLVDDDRGSVHNKAGLFGIEIEGKPCKVSVRDVWVKKIAS